MRKEEYWLIKRPIYGIREYFNTCYKTVEDELNQIEELNKQGYYEDFGEYEGAPDVALTRSDKIYFSTLNELNVLCEKIIRKIYFKIITNIKTKEKKYDNKNLIDVFMQQNEDAKYQLLTYDENIFKCIENIEKHHNIKFDSILEYSVFVEIREQINSYKHRDSVKHKFKKKSTINYNMIYEKYFAFELEIEKTINSIELFLLQIYKLTNSNIQNR